MRTSNRHLHFAPCLNPSCSACRWPLVNYACSYEAVICGSDYEARIFFRFQYIVATLMTRTTSSVS